MTESRAATYREVFAVGEFRALFAAQSLSVVGDQFARVALTVLVFQRTGSASLTALTYALTMLPDVVARPLLSGLADRFRRREVMVVADVARAVLVAAMAVPGMPLLWLCVLLVAVQVLASPFDAARMATLPLLFTTPGDDGPDDRYVVANSLSNMVHDAAQLVGFATGGLLVVGVDPSGALLADAATFVASAVLIRLWVADRPAPEDDDAAGAASATRRWARGIAAGARLVWGDRRRATLVGLLCVPAFPVVTEGLAVPYGAQLGMPVAAIGLLFAVGPLGSLIGMVLLNRVAPRRRVALMPHLAVASCAVLVLCLAEPGLAATLVIWGLSGAASAYFVVANAQFVLSVPDSRRGQAGGLAAMAVRVSQGLAVVLAGVAADLVRPSVAIVAAGAVGAVVAWALGRGWSRADAAAGTGTGAPADDTR